VATRRTDKNSNTPARKKRAGSTNNSSAKKTETTQKPIVIACTVLGVLLVLFLAISTYAMYSGDRTLAKNGLTLLGMDIGGKNAAEIETMLQENDAVNAFSVTFTCNNIQQTVTAEDVSLKIDTKKTAEHAVAHGRENLFSAFASLFGSKTLTPIYTYDPIALSDVSVVLSEKCGGTLKQHQIVIEDTQIVIKAGQKGSGVELTEIKKRFEDAVLNGGGSYTLKMTNTEPAEIDVEELYSTVYSEPADAHYSIEGKEVIIAPEVNGKSFNKEDAKHKLAGFKPGSADVIIPLDITPATVKAADINKTLFADVLGESKSKYVVSNRNRSNNVELAAKYVHGTILLPGDEFSYNNIVGPRTYERGFKAASVYENNKMVDGLGGGICQTSSTIYSAVLYADLEVTERHEHTLEVSYVPLGTDATVAYGSLDFRFKNNTSAPIKISAVAANGVVTVKVLGTKENPNKTVEIVTNRKYYNPYTTTTIEDATLEPGAKVVESTGFNGATVETYKIIKENGVQISNTLIHTSRYVMAPRVERVGPTSELPTDGSNPDATTPTDGDVVIEGNQSTAEQIYDDLQIPDGI